jgi:microcompartment protein CcmK/EutM
MWEWIYQPEYGILNHLLHGMFAIRPHWTGDPYLALGAVVASRRAEGLEPVRLLWVQPEDAKGRPVGIPQVAADAVRAQLGERVTCVDGREAALALAEPFVPVDAAIVGHVEGVEVG